MEKAIEKFERLTGYPLGMLLAEFRLFNERDFGRIVAYYNGSTSANIQSSFKFLANLLEQSKYVDFLYEGVRNRMDDIFDWQLYEQLNEMRTRLDTAGKLWKYQRSNKIKDSWKRSGLQFDYRMSKYETPADISRIILREAGFNDSWVDWAVENSLLEADYTGEGDPTVKLNATLPQFRLRAVLGSAIGVLAYGIDLQRKLEFDPAEQDLKVLAPLETWRQTIDIILTLRKTDIPTIPSLGINEGVVAGSNISQLSLPTLKRELTEVISSDDTIASYTLEKVERDKDSLRVSLALVSSFTAREQATLTVNT